MGHNQLYKGEGILSYIDNVFSLKVLGSDFYYPQKHLVQEMRTIVDHYHYIFLKSEGNDYRVPHKNPPKNRKLGTLIVGIFVIVI